MKPLRLLLVEDSEADATLLVEHLRQGGYEPDFTRVDSAKALNKALELDPITMAECHLALAHLYELAGAKQLATKEYKEFLKKVPGYSDRKKLEKFINDNPE